MYFDDLLSQAQKNYKKPTEVAVSESTKPKKEDDWKAKLQLLPSDIIVPKVGGPVIKSTSKEVGSKSNGNSKQPSFKELMKMAKANKAEGLLRKDTQPEEERIIRIVKPEKLQMRILESKSGIQSMSSYPSSSISNNGLEKKQVRNIDSKPLHQILKSSYTSKPTTQKTRKVSSGSSKSPANPKFIKLNTQKRDLASMEDILADIKAKKASANGDTKNSEPKQGKQIGRPTVAYSSRKSTIQDLKKKSDSPQMAEPIVKPKKISHGIDKRPALKYARHSDSYSSGSDDMEAGFFDMEQEERKRFI